MNGEVLIVDEHTGRMLAGRRYNEGMHQAIEAKEGVEIKNENQTLATITLQNYFRMYDKLSGMTGTAADRGRRAQLDLQARRRRHPDEPADDPRRTRPTSSTAPRRPSSTRSSTTSSSGTRTASRCSSAPSRVEKSEYLSDQLRRSGVPHEVLNAKQHEREAAIVAQAGRKGAVTVATNMAGRGTDIMLGGNAEFRAVAALKQQRARPGGDPGGVRGRVGRGARQAAEKAVAGRARRGHRARWPLRPRHRAARVAPHRQPAAWPLRPPGRPRRVAGSTSRSTDDLMRLFNAGAGRPVHDHGQHGGRRRRSSPRWSRARSRARRPRSRRRNFEIRKNVLKYDDVLNRQREVIYDERRRVLEGEDLHEQLRHFVNDVVDGYVDAATADGFAEDWDLDAAVDRAARPLYPVSRHRRGGRGRGRRPVGRSRAELLREELLSDAHHAYDAARGGARRRGACARSSAGSSCRCSTASGASTSTRWTTSRRASACARWPSATRWSSTSARASSSSRR